MIHVDAIELHGLFFLQVYGPNNMRFINLQKKKNNTNILQCELNKLVQ